MYHKIYCVAQNLHIKKFTNIKKKPGDRVNFKILCHENLKINFARPNTLIQGEFDQK